MVDPLDQSNGICSWFVEAVKLMDIDIPYDTSPENWIENIPIHKRTQFNASIPIISSISSKSEELSPLWVIIEYGKQPIVTPYSESPIIMPLHQDVEKMIVINGVPIVIGGGGGIANRCEPKVGCDETTQVYVHGGPGIDLFNGVAQLHFGIQAGDDTGLYLEGEVFGQNCGLKLSSPDMGVYSPYGEVGISTQIYQTHWILTTEQSVLKDGGYQLFGNQHVGRGFSYIVLDKDFNRDSLVNRWITKYGLYSKLEEKP
ncbi:MAG: hypothetical protein JEZ06_23560 [Anaerolineaceae bacterium]|nr:hypothetical protein [Anaerolineaceae bacterium]